MKTKIALGILTAAALLCGCTRQAKWDYKVVEIENSAAADKEKDEASYFHSNGADSALKNLNYDLAEAGDFEFDSTNLDKSIGALGEDGWELVAAIPQTETTHPVADDNVISAVRTVKIILIFKRLEKKF